MSQSTNQLDTTIAQHEQEAQDLTRTLPASKKVYVQGSRPISKYHFARLVSLTHPQDLPKMALKKMSRFWCMIPRAFILTPMLALI